MPCISFQLHSFEGCDEADWFVQTGIASVAKTNVISGSGGLLGPVICAVLRDVCVMY